MSLDETVARHYEALQSVNADPAMDPNGPNATKSNPANFRTLGNSSRATPERRKGSSPQARGTQNTRRGLAHARAQGRVGGRPRVMDADRTATARQLREEGKSYAQIGKILGVSAASIYRSLSSENP